MPDYGQELRFGVFIPPEAAQMETVLELAALADTLALDYVTFQDHPYQARFLDTWTLLSVVGARTTHVRVAPNVANLPLRQPVVLARSVATLDRITGGRVELGLGAGAFFDAIAANGGPQLTAPQAVDALEEALDVIRGIWSTERSIRHEGEHYRIAGARPGPPPAHDIEIWLGAYKPRMLRMTGAKADGWLPSMGYIELDALPAANAAIDEAAAAAGRRPADVRRMLNVLGDSLGAEELAELTLTTGMSAYIQAVSTADELRRWAEDVVPAVRELVEAGRGREAGAPQPAPAASTSAAPGGDRAPFAAVATPDTGARLADEAPWDESTRPTGPAPDPQRRYTRDEQAAGQHLVDVHDALRAELERLRDLIEQVGRGTVDPAQVRSFITRMTIRQNAWTLGAFCASYCRVVTQHHTLEDRSVFPHLRRSEPALEAVLERLGEEHETIAELLDRVDRALVDLVSPEADLPGVRRAVDLLTDALLSHFSYEERELIEPLARHGFY
jgi:alkanesulfonate monooxygenase SsuD/methylene tetrahydromethanopterin reductase-like flavin-dependent oxidoreductase (luciferase family)